MPVSEPAQPLRAENPEPTFTFDDRHWRVRGLEKQLSRDRLKVNLMVTRRALFHVDSLDLCAARLRLRFIKEAAAELLVDEATVKKDLGHVLLRLEALQETLIQQQLGAHEEAPPAMSAQERDDALALLKDPRLLRRIADDLDACGLVGETVGKLVCYLACVSRHLPRPLSVLIQSSSGAGKTTLQDAVLRLMPPEHQVRLSALTAQSLYYMPRDRLRHKVLAVAEEQGLQQAAYALKLLQSEGRISIACAQRDGASGRQQTELYEVEGPVAMLLTTTAERPDEELANRCVTIHTNERPEQTAAIHQRQRAAHGRKPAGSAADTEAIERRHQNAQRLLEPVRVVIPWAEELTFRTDRISARRDNAKYLALIASLALLHQYQRKRVTLDGQASVLATLDDVAVANRLARAALCPARDALLPQTRRLWTLLRAYVSQRAAREKVSHGDVRFTQRQAREALAWNDRTLRRHLRRLVELEYVANLRSGHGNGRVYQLLVDGIPSSDPGTLLGLCDVAKLRALERSPRR